VYVCRKLANEIRDIITNVRRVVFCARVVARSALLRLMLWICCRLVYVFLSQQNNSRPTYSTYPGVIDMLYNKSTRPQQFEVMEFAYKVSSFASLHRESKKQDTKHLAITSLTIIRFSKFYTSQLGSKFETNSCLNIPPRFKHVAKLPCVI